MLFLRFSFKCLRANAVCSLVAIAGKLPQALSQETEERMQFEARSLGKQILRSNAASKASTQNATLHSINLDLLSCSFSRIEKTF